MRKLFTDWDMDSWTRVCAAIVVGVFTLVVVGALILIGLNMVGMPNGEVKPTKTMTVILPDSRRVQCISVGGGVSCDWPHANGADNNDMEDMR